MCFFKIIQIRIGSYIRTYVPILGLIAVRVCVCVCSGVAGGEGSTMAERLALLETKELNERQRADLAILRQKQAQAGI